MDTQFSIKQTTMCAINGTTSSEAQVRSGVPQGLVLGPLTFIIHISYINYEIADSSVSCFADDTRILLGIKYEGDTKMLQNDLHKLYKWADTNNMKFNANVENSDSIENSLHFNEIATVFTSWRRDGVNQK